MTHHDPAALVEAELQATVLAAVAVVYLAATRRLCRRSTTWPRWRTARWLVGVATAIAGAVALSLGGHDLPLHVAGHLLLGMLAPVLLVTAAPVTLALRALSRERARVLGRLLRSRPLAVLTHPAAAALLDVGGLWLLYRTDVPATVPPLVVHVHMLLAGYLFAFALIGPDPAPHRPGFAVRTGAPVVAVAAHDVLAKLLYARRRRGWQRRRPRSRACSCTTARHRCTSPCSPCWAASGSPYSGGRANEWGGGRLSRWGGEPPRQRG